MTPENYRTCPSSRRPGFGCNMYMYVSRSRPWSGGGKVERCDEISLERRTCPERRSCPAYVVRTVRESRATPGLSM